ncbi:MAG: hypothetical protein KAT43_05935 [Nanoarchaeota archaeon]|nr:hypothetical protein [Nanoarchaeota archaeon]
MAYLEGAIKFLVRLGLLDVVLPFLLTFVLVYALLEKTKVLGEEDGQPKKRLNIIVALIAGLLFVNLIRYTDFVTWFLFIVIVIVMIFVVQLLTSMLGVSMKLTAWIIVPALVFFIVLFTYKFIDYSILLSALFHPFTVFIIVVGIGLYFVVKGPKKKLTEEEKKKLKEEKEKAAKEKKGKKKEKPEEKYELEEVGRIPAEKLEGEEGFTKRFTPLR